MAFPKKGQQKAPPNGGAFQYSAAKALLP